MFLGPCVIREWSFWNGKREAALLKRGRSRFRVATPVNKYRAGSLIGSAFQYVIVSGRDSLRQYLFEFFAQSKIHCTPKKLPFIKFFARTGSNPLSASAQIRRVDLCRKTLPEAEVEDGKTVFTVRQDPHLGHSARGQPFCKSRKISKKTPS